MKYLIILIVFLASCQKIPTYPIGQILTPKGEMLFWLYDDTPIHKASFIELANGSFWDSLIFNRVIEDFVIQGGCPDTEEGFTDSPYLLQPEFHDHIKHTYGALGAGRDGNAEKLSAGCQLYIVDNEEGIPRLDGDYMIFGQLFKGYEVLDAIAKVDTDSLDQPIVDISMEVNVVYLNKEELKEKGFDMEDISVEDLILIDQVVK